MTPPGAFPGWSGGESSRVAAGDRVSGRRLRSRGSGDHDRCGGLRYKCISIRVLPNVLGFTRARSRNSATPSSRDRKISA